MANCKFCGKEIFWGKEGRKNKAYEMDGGEHSCEEMKQSFKGIKTLSRDSISPEEIARYEKMINEKSQKKK